MIEPLGCSVLDTPHTRGTTICFAAKTLFRSACHQNACSRDPLARGDRPHRTGYPAFVGYADLLTARKDPPNRTRETSFTGVGHAHVKPAFSTRIDND